jgi:hypothetical protein
VIPFWLGASAATFGAARVEHDSEDDLYNPAPIFGNYLGRSKPSPASVPAGVFDPA